MLKVYVCEDITVQREKIKKIVENIILMEDLDMELAVVTGDPEEMLEVVKQSGEVGIRWNRAMSREFIFWILI